MEKYIQALLLDYCWKIVSALGVKLIFQERFSGQNFAEFAAQGSQCSATHASYITEKGGKIHWLKHLRVRRLEISNIL